MSADLIESYLTSQVNTPYFLFVSDEKYRSAVEEANVQGLKIIPMSRFCGDVDKVPDIDDLLDLIESPDTEETGGKFAVVGLGEFLALCGTDEVIHTMSRLKNARLDGKKVVLILRGLMPQIAEMERDPRFDSRRHGVIDHAECNLSFTLVGSPGGFPAEAGFKAMLQKLEKGRNGDIVFSSSVNLDKALFTIRRIDDAYAGIKFFVKNFNLPRSLGTDDQWTALLSELSEKAYSLDAVFAKHEFDENAASELYAAITERNYESWLYFICLKSKADAIENRYLRYVLERTDRCEELPGNILNAIIEIPHTDQRFPTFAKGRHALVKNVPESDIADFVRNNRRVVSESVYRLTDGTKAERQEMIAWAANNGIVPEMKSLYPALDMYLKKYVFKTSELAELLTDYFEAYKRQKLSNSLEPEFLDQIDILARQRMFNRLPTRNDILDSLDKDGTYLYWVDALGVEYLSLIEALAQKKGLCISVSIARAELPTITSKNRDFFDNWVGKKRKNGDLDDIKHHEAGGFNFDDNKLPIHLAAELDVITEVMETAATELAFKRCKRFLIVSDHGASRLAVLRRKEEKYDTDTPGEHSGRCCKLFEPYELPFAAEENGYLILADYGRFKKSRAANVEVHGGASLEEAVIPVIELSLKDSGVIVKLADEEEPVVVDFRTGAEITLFIDSPVKNVCVILNGKPYPAVPLDENHYSVKLPDMRRAGSYSADVYTGDNLIGKVLIKAQGKSGKVNDAFDELF